MTKELIDPYWVFENHNEAADLIKRLTIENENLLLANRDCLDHFNVMKDDLAAAQKRIGLYEQALLASWPEGAVGAAFDYWNAARKEDK